MNNKLAATIVAVLPGALLLQLACFERRDSANLQGYSPISPLTHVQDASVLRCNNVFPGPDNPPGSEAHMWCEGNELSLIHI